jgi:hypothetical protein
MRAPAGSNNDASMPESDQGKILLSYLESARDLLARRLVHEYHTVTDPDLNYTTTSSILQILFLKTGQECGFVEPGTLTALAGCDGIAKRMARACSDAGISPGNFFENGQEGSRSFPGFSDEPLREIIHRTDPPDFPVPVVRLPLEALVTVLEQFFGTKLQAAEGSRVKRVGKSALLYTGVVDIPLQMNVEYMVREAIGGMTGGYTMDHMPVCRILDPACGAGLFLLAAYRFLAKKIQVSGDCPEQMQQVLQDLVCKSVYGTDLDPESVSAARTVLLFAFVEESRRAGFGVKSPGQICAVFKCLIKTIRCGNALIAPDYFSGKPVYPFNADERRKVNPFDWKKAFPEIMEEGGFDVVIGAPPPYRPFAIQAREEYFQTHYDTYAPAAGLFGYFIERGFSLLKPGGVISVLVPGAFLRSQNAQPLRRLILSRQIVMITNTGRVRLLPEGEVLMYVLTLINQTPNRPFIVSPYWNSARSLQGVYSGAYDFTLDQRSFDDGGWILDDTRTADILEKIQITGTPLEQYVMGEIGVGICRIKDNPLVVDQTMKNRLTKRAWWCRHFFIPLLRPVDIRRYVSEKPEMFVLSIRDSRNLRKCRALAKFLETIKGDINRTSGFNERNGVSDLEGDRPKIVFAPFQHNPAFCYDQKGSCIIANTLLTIPRNDPFLLGILNSSLGRFIITHICSLNDRGYHISPTAMGKFPLCTPDFDNPDEKARYDRMVALVNEMLELHKHLSYTKTDQEKRIIAQKIETTDWQINTQVYEIYGLTLEEIAVVESISPS